MNLEALAIVFQNKDEPYLLFYPAALLAVAVFAVIGLGAFQWLTRLVEESREDSQGGDSRSGSGSKPKQ